MPLRCGKALQPKNNSCSRQVALTCTYLYSTSLTINITLKHERLRSNVQKGGGGIA